MSNLAFGAMVEAKNFHLLQVRKYTGNPYCDHLAEVAGIVATVTSPEDMPKVLATAWLHDCVEDCGISADYLQETFGDEVTAGVIMLSDIEIGNRATRKALSRERLAAAPAWVQNIKVADMISNTSSIIKHDPKFAVIYLAEKRLLLNVLTKADLRLVALATSQCELT